MSETGLFSNIYDQTREFAVMLDEVLIHLKDGSSSPSDRERQELGRLLINLAGPRYDDPSNRMTVLMLNGIVQISPSDLTRAGEMLLGKEANRESMETLERFAQTLEQEQAKAMARMGGHLE